MKVLLGSGGFRGEERREVLRQAMRAHFGEIERLLFVPYALADGDAYVQAMQDAGLDAGYDLVGLHSFSDPKQAVRDCEAVYVGGGNSFRLIDRLHREGLVDLIRERVQGGLAYMGVSAGSNVACPSMKTTNDMPIVQPASFQSFGLVPFQVNAHYYPGQIHVKREDGSYEEHFGETRDQRIREFHEENSVPVLGLWESALLSRDGDKLCLDYGEARLFRRDTDPVDYLAGADLSELLGD